MTALMHAAANGHGATCQCFLNIGARKAAPGWGFPGPSGLEFKGFRVWGFGVYRNCIGFRSKKRPKRFDPRFTLLGREEGGPVGVFRGGRPFWGHQFVNLRRFGLAVSTTSVRKLPDIKRRKRMQ